MKPVWATVISCWLVAVTGGLGCLMRYDLTPGEAANAPSSWPTRSKLKPSATLPTLVMVVHPRCPCSRASLDQLKQLTMQNPHRFEARVLMVRPDCGANTSEWENTDSWKAACSIASAEVISDPDGIESEHFGARTSGQTYLYSNAGRLLFSGGITASRGQYDSNPNAQALDAMVKSPSPDGPVTSLVFGCKASKWGAND